MADAMRKWKSLSSGWVHKSMPDNLEFAWQTGYAAFSVSRSSADRVAAYIDNQVEHHKHLTFKEEFVAFLERHRVQYDPERVWE